MYLNEAKRASLAIYGVSKVNSVLVSIAFYQYILALVRSTLPIPQSQCHCYWYSFHKRMCLIC